MKTSLKTAVSLSACLAMAACGSSSGASSAGSSKGPIKIGVINSDTGTYAFAGVVAHRAMDIAVEKLNAAGGIQGRKVVLDIQDDASQTSQSLALLGKYAADRDTIAVIGPTATPLSVALGPVATAREIPLVGATVISGAALKSGPWTFKTAANPTSIMADLAKTAATQLKVKRVAVIFGSDNEGQIDQKKAFEEGLRANGAEVVAEVGVLNTDTNFTSAAQKVVAAKPDALFVSLTGDASGNAVAQASSAGLDKGVQILGTSQSVSPQYLKIGGDSVEGTVAGADYDPSLPGEENKYFRDAYQKKYNMLPDAYAALGYQAIQSIAQALGKITGDLSRDALRQALTTQRSFDGVLGDGKYAVGTDRIPTYGVALLKVQSGKYVTFQ